ncbi:hypothetical protein MUN78_06945 [Leucobacter allii]|uniref:Uncharacterized protein n=1 Tax=Leucobacter allii TaxID=2932247 RepID=A0ABY4FQJ0_9MICO|nr:hypothetical protein [Leucobacter allii]UOQ58553.1 hypothetical protein MUN78_06945 [Leucobacter allii]
MTAEDWAPYGIGEPDADGWFPDYRPVPEELRPAESAAVTPTGKDTVDTSLVALVSHWRLVVADLALHYHVDLYDPAVLARPWPGVRTMIFSLLDSDTRLRAALTRR